MSERETVGTYLKREREERKISLKEVSKQIKVREQFLRAIEEERPDLLPSTTYVKGFLSAYARYLGLDPSEVIRRYEVERRGEPLTEPEPPVRKRLGWSPKLVWVMGGAAIGVFVVVYLLLSPSHPPVVTLPSKPEATEPLLPSTPPAVSETPAAPVEREMELTLKATEMTWVSIKLDEQTTREAMLHPGDHITYRASKRIEMVVGNAGGVEMTFNGRRVETIGRRGEVVNVIFTSQGMETLRREPQKPTKQ